MDRDVFQPIVDYYQNQLLLGFYRKRGKSLAVPYIIFAINRLLEKVKNRNIKIIDVGCGKGDLIQIIEGVCKSMNVAERVELYGLDYNQELLKQVKSGNPSVKQVYRRDLRHDLLVDLYGKFDLVISINTIHEVFSLLLGGARSGGRKANGSTTKLVLSRVKDLMGAMTQLLTEDGSLILYDGLNIEKKLQIKTIKFKIKNELLVSYFDKFIDEFSPIELKYTLVDKSKHIYEMSYQDFHRFIVTFKFLNTSLWPIESRESYAYASLSDIKEVLTRNGLIVESLVVSNNDLGLWSHNVEILTEDADFGYKVYLLMASKRFLPSEFEHFCS